MVANLSSVETHRIRLIHGLPSGDLFTDEMEAFDRRSRNGIIVEMHEQAQLDAPFLILADAMISNATLRVLHTGFASAVFKPTVGVAQGKKLSPIQYCVSTSASASTIANWPGVGIDLNPDAMALTAFHAHRNYTDAQHLDLDEVNQWLLLYDIGMKWDDIMASASSDAFRLHLLDRTCTLVSSTRQYIDDRKCKVASRAQAATTMAPV